MDPQLCHVEKNVFVLDGEQKNRCQQNGQNGPGKCSAILKINVRTSAPHVSGLGLSLLGHITPVRAGPVC